MAKKMVTDLGEPPLPSSLPHRWQDSMSSTKLCSCTVATDTSRSPTLPPSPPLTPHLPPQDYQVERLLRDVRVHQILEGTNEIMSHIVGKALVA
jgi:hypothetical protein